ncbi:Mur ligase family protein, partial [Patescibacteria group bacterium]
TREHNNTLIGIAKQILRELEDGHQVYLVEMGAYRKGEIKALCKLTPPQMGMVTGLGTQHLGLFGSLANLAQAKYELIKSLPPSGQAFFNFDCPACLPLSQRAFSQGLETITFSTKDKAASLYAREIKLKRKSVQFEIVWQGEKKQFSAPLLGRQGISNLLGAIALGLKMDLPFPVIKKAIYRLATLSGTMELAFGPRRVTLVNDSYNSNSEGVLAALEYLSVYQGQKVLCFQPLIELGEATEKEHHRVLKKAAEVCQLILLTNRNFYRIIKEALPREEREKLVLIKSKRFFIKRLGPYFKKANVVLFSGRETKKYFDLLKL